MSATTSRTTQSNGTDAHLSVTQPPTRHDIDAFMLQYSAHLPFPVLDEGEIDDCGAQKLQQRQRRSFPRLLAPYMYTGADYSLVLAACFPTRCIDLAALNWSATPLVSQRQGNLRVFCAAARALALPDAPLSALHAELLQSHPSCVVAHLKVQHWLYSLSLRFAPQSTHDAAALRAVHRHLQLGEPYLKRSRTEGLLASCPSVHECTPFSAQDLQRCCGPILAPQPPFTAEHNASDDGGASSATATSSAAVAAASSAGKENVRGNAAASLGASSSPSNTSEEAMRCGRQKPWLNYSKPWLLPSLKAAEAKKAALEAAAVRRAQEERERNPRYTAFATQSKDVEQQYALSAAAAAERRDQLRAIKTLLVGKIALGETVDFKEVAERLHGRC